jgi:hypothetical protein
MIDKLTFLAALVAAPAALAAPQPTALNISARPAVVTYGFSTKLLGAVSPPESASVSVDADACLNAPPGSEFASPLTVTSDSLGHWSVRVTPRVRTLFQATSGDAQSAPLMVNVRPRVKLTRLAHHRFRTSIFAAQSFAGKRASFQRQTAFGWKTLKTVRLAQTGANGPTIISGATFRSGIAHRRVVRVLLTQKQVGNCYLPGWSSTVRT